MKSLSVLDKSPVAVYLAEKSTKSIQIFQIFLCINICSICFDFFANAQQPVCDFCLQSTLFLRHLCTPVGQTHDPCVPTYLLPANHLDNRTNHQGQSSMFKVQNQSPYIPHNNQLVHPFARQLSTKWIINDLHFVFQSQLFRRAIWLVSSRNMTRITEQSQPFYTRQAIWCLARPSCVYRQTSVYDDTVFINFVLEIRKDVAYDPKGSFKSLPTVEVCSDTLTTVLP